MPATDPHQLYERGLAACRAGDTRAVREVVMALLDALNFEYEEAAAGFCRLYQQCLRHANARRFTALAAIFEKLADTPKRRRR